jgi:fructose-bisphosphate aldolase, class I
VSGVILFEETLYQKADDGTPFVDIMKALNILPGIKVIGGLLNQITVPFFVFTKTNVKSIVFLTG